MTRATFAILASVFVITAGALVAISFARGYKFDPTTGQVNGTGILVATSDPNGAEVLINGNLKTATNNSINLPPNTYDVTIQLDGFSSWQKKVDIKNEEVFKTNAFLFPRVPDLRPLTLTGALNPTLSPDQTKIAFGVASASAQRNGIWVIDMSHSFLPGPINLGTDARQIYRESSSLILSSAKLLWSADSKQIIAYFGPTPALATPSGQPLPDHTLSSTPTLAFLLDSDRMSSLSAPMTPEQIAQSLLDWKLFSDTRTQAQMSKLPPKLNTFLIQNANKISFSLDESKIFYQATNSATLAQMNKDYIPGRNPIEETRSVRPNNYYVYDIKEDKNYQIDNCQLSIVNCSWFPSSRHILAFTSKEISVMDFDGTNKAVLYAGPFVDAIVFAWPNWSKIVILTSLNQIGENLYTINLR